MTIKNIIGKSGRSVANQFIIHDEKTGGLYFQSYDSIIAKKENDKIYLDSKYWNYSRTTNKYRNLFLRETTKETQEKINSGRYILVDLN